jgi:hypothetical protein
MLGGKFCAEEGKLIITMATPCNSISTGMQCEMDPGNYIVRIINYSFTLDLLEHVYTNLFMVELLSE